VLNGDKTDSQILTYHQNCDPGLEYREMMDTKRAIGKLDGRQCYHIIQSFKPGEVSPELALEIAKEFAAEYLPDYEVVIGTHVDRKHIHSHLIFNSVNAQTGRKYHISTQEYYRQIRAISDRLCREHGLSVVMEGRPSQAVSYIEWLRQSKGQPRPSGTGLGRPGGNMPGQPTFRSMLEADLRTAIEDANDLGHFFMLMEHKGWEISHGNRLGFRLRGQERFMYPGRKNTLFTEDGIRAAIAGNLEDIEAGHRPEVIHRPYYQPYKEHPKYSGFMALYVHYLYVLGKTEKRQYPPRMTPRLRKEVMRFERYREQFSFLRENNIVSQEDMTAFQSRAEEELANLMKQRTILNVRKKKRKGLYNALADVEVLAQAKALYKEGLSGMEAEFSRYMEAEAVLEQSGVPWERITAEKAAIYEQLAQVNADIRAARKKLALRKEIQDRLPQMERTIEKIESREMENHEKHRGR